MPPEFKLHSSREFNSNSIERYTINRFVLKLVGIYLLSIITAYLLSNGLWSKDAAFVHTVFESFCIFTALAAFITIWSIYDSKAMADNIIGFGLLAVAIFDTFHAFYYPILKLYPGSYFDLGTRFWILGRMTEAIVFFLSSTGLIKKGIRKQTTLVTTLSVSIAASLVVINFPKVLPVLMIPPFTMTLPKIILEYVVIALFVITLFNLNKSRDSRNLITNSYVLIVLLLAIPSEFCFTVFKAYNSFTAVLGHVLRMAYYYCIFRGIFVSAVIYPKEQLKEYNSHINQVSDFTYSLLNRLPVAFTYYNKESQLIFMNKRSTEIIGYSLGDIYGVTVYELLDILCRGNKENVHEYIDKVNSAETEKSTNTTALITTKNGEKVNITIETYRLANGEIICFFGEAKEEQSLNNLRLQTQTVLNSMNKMVIVVDPQGNIVMCNGFFMDMCEFEDTVTGRNVLEIARLLQFEVHEEVNKNEFEVHFTTASGYKRELLINISEINDMEGFNLGRIIIGTDVTEMKREEARIRQQEKLAMIGQMAAGIVHEIKNPLAAIKGFGQLISAKAKTDKVREYAMAIDTSINDLNKVVTDFLKFAKPMQPVKKTIKLNDLLRSSELLISTHAYNKNINCKYSYAENEAAVTADEGQIKQVLLNIVDNAIDAMADAHMPQLKIATGYNEAKNEMMIWVTDNGKGMTQKEKQSIGTPFYTTKDKGTGLGMSICYQIISEHGGIIEIESETEKGTTFIVSLPCSVGQNEKTRQ